MKNQLASRSRNSAAPVADRSLARDALSQLEWDSVQRAKDHKSATLRDTRTELERGLATPLKQFEPKLDGMLSAKVKGPLSTIGSKIRPDLSAPQATAWIDAMVIALSDLPPNVAAKAAERALHVAFQFPSEVEGKLREFANEHLQRIENAIARLKASEAASWRSLHPQPLIADRFAKSEPMTDDEVHELQRGGPISKQLLRMGLKAGYIDNEQLLPLDEHPIGHEDDD